MYWDLVVIKVRSVDKNCLHMEICQPNKNCLFWSHLVKNVTKLRQSTILSCSLTLGDKWSRNRLEVSWQKRPALKASQATLIYFSWSHLVKNMTKCRKAMIPWWISETDWLMVMQQKWSQLTKIAPLKNLLTYMEVLILVTNDQNCWKTESGKHFGLTPLWGSVW